MGGWYYYTLNNIVNLDKYDLNRNSFIAAGTL